ncbi:hypothetical protein HPB50_015470 [Hyalomma asiaticum]|uniref:Uncharacterized protein n=1 Tax=Hyalomma asiaticum TaxID=266040 RepID=A0ACB7T248_HYAAI|nr:hypothetical protein HPB50_015470 [Hyalomma asiaticum]
MVRSTRPPPPPSVPKYSIMDRSSVGPFCLYGEAKVWVAMCMQLLERHSKRCSILRRPNSSSGRELLVDTRVLEGRVTVRLRTLNQSVPFRGFLIRAMALKGNNWVYFRGLFEKDAKFQDSQYLDCDGHEKVP